MINTTIDSRAGFCFGVDMAVKKVEALLEKGETIYCLGQIVHNAAEVERLEAKGMKTITHEEFYKLRNAKVLVRAHGEPPETYSSARQHNIELIEGSCPVVLKLQDQIAYSRNNNPEAQIVIFGKPGHAEVEGLNGKAGGEALIVTGEADLYKIDFTREVIMYSQTTRSIREFHRLADIIRSRLEQQHPKAALALELHDTICREVAHRDEELQDFAKQHDKILFISGRNSSNGRMLYNAALEVNPETYFVSRIEEIEYVWFSHGDDVGISGATSTPRWMMEAAQENLQEAFE